MQTMPLLTKLEQFAKLSDADKQALEDVAQGVTYHEAKEDIISQGDSPIGVHLLLEGWAGRYKILPDGERMIMAYLIPGDLCDVNVMLLDQMDHSIGALSACTVMHFPREGLAELMGKNEKISRALWWASLVDEAILREWLVNVGRRSADKRIAHLVCEMLLRCKAVGLTDDNSFDLPLTQEQLADTMGVSAVQMNRSLQLLRGEGLINSDGRQVTIDDLPRLMEFCDFDPVYLHQIYPKA